MPIAIWALSIGAFGIGTTEFVVMGLLLQMATDLNISISAAGYIITAYALGVVIGAPLLTPLLGRYPRRAALVGLMVVFTVGNIACALSGSLSWILLARVLTAFAHASYFGIGSVVAADIAPPSRKSSAIAAMFLGATLANIIGVPGGTWLGQAFGWRSTFVVVAVLGGIATLATAWFIPRQSASPTKPDLASEWKAIGRVDVLRAFAITAFGFGGTFTAFTYIAPMLTEVTHVPEAWVAPILLLFGVGMVIGNPLGGRLADKSTHLALTVSLAFLAAMLFVLPMALSNVYLAAIVVLLLGVAMFSTIPPLQTNAIELGRDAPTLAASCNIAAFNLGNAGGAWLGGAMIASGMPLTSVPMAAGVVTLIGLALVLLSRRACSKGPWATSSDGYSNR